MPVYRCADCGYATNRRSDLDKHVVKHSGSKPYRCQHAGCNFVSAYARALAHHKWVHQTNKPLKCDQPGCRFQTANSANLADHKSTHSGQKSHACDFPGCSFTTAHAGALTNHRRTHTGEKPFKCQEEGCSFSATNASILRVHIMRHTGVKPYHCEYGGCTYASCNSGHLQRHVRSKHTGARPYLCPEPGCNADFACDSGLRRHALIHTGDRRFNCIEPGCGHSAYTKSDLRKHMQTHTGEKPCHCPADDCDYACAQPGNLRQHYKAWHSEEASARKRLQEMRIKDALTEAGIPFTPNVYICLRSLGGTFRLVDFVIYTKHGIIYLEIDEYGHQRYGISGECERMHLIHEKQLLRKDSRPAAFIRYNPNTYMKQGIKQLVSRSDTAQAEKARSAREKTLVDKIQKMEFGQDKTLQVLYMYYDCHCPFTTDAKHKYHLDIWRNSEYCPELLSVCLPVVV